MSMLTVNIVCRFYEGYFIIEYFILKGNYRMKWSLSRLCPEAEDRRQIFDNEEPQ